MAYHRVQLLLHGFVVNHHLVHLRNQLVKLGWISRANCPWVPQQVCTAADRETVNECGVAAGCSDTNRIAKQLDMKNKLRTNNSCSLAWVGLEDSREHISKLRRRAAVQGRSQLQVSASASAPKTCQTEKQFTEFSGFARG